MFSNIKFVLLFLSVFQLAYGQDLDSLDSLDSDNEVQQYRFRAHANPRLKIYTLSFKTPLRRIHKDAFTTKSLSHNQFANLFSGYRNLRFTVRQSRRSPLRTVYDFAGGVDSPASKLATQISIIRNSRKVSFNDLIAYRPTRCLYESLYSKRYATRSHMVNTVFKHNLNTLRNLGVLANMAFHLDNHVDLSADISSRLTSSAPSIAALVRNVLEEKQRIDYYIEQALNRNTMKNRDKNVKQLIALKEYIDKSFDVILEVSTSKHVSQKDRLTILEALYVLAAKFVQNHETVVDNLKITKFSFGAI